MKYLTLLPLLLCPFLGFSYVQKSQIPTEKLENPLKTTIVTQISKLTLRPQNSLEAFSYIENLINKLPWFKENGYTVALPDDPRFSNFYSGKENLYDKKKQELINLFKNEIYKPSLCTISMEKLINAEEHIDNSLDKLEALKKNWGFDLLDEYEIVLTFYGPGGDYNTPKKGTIRLFTTPEGKFKRQIGYEVLIHEIVHIGIEETVIKEYKLTHWEKERLVDLICSVYLKEILPTYKLQSKGDSRIDQFINEDIIIRNLPFAIEKYIKKYPR